ncbi:hypothetical protein [Haladaptatus sp. DFWS20]|uniref:hypothetical protein n=1 Tax=Haladaptatus sp. DFWS20 TaxID=3403467 RepID=UPI003EBF453A
MDQTLNDLAKFAEEHDVEFDELFECIETIATSLSAIVEPGEETIAAAKDVADAAEEQIAEINQETQRPEDLTRYCCSAQGGAQSVRDPI